MKISCADSSNTYYSKILSILSATGTFTIFLCLRIYFLINSVYITVLSTAFSCHTDIGQHIWQSCLRLSLNIFWVNLYLMTYFQIVPCWHMLLECLPFFSASDDIISLAIFLYQLAIALLSAHETASDEVLVSPISRICSRIDPPSRF